jgi:hypothetical protein
MEREFVFRRKGEFSMNDQNTHQNLRDLLERLHSELEQTESVDEKGNEMLSHLDTDIRALLARSGRKKESDEPVLERLQETKEHFETSHPSLTLTLSEMMTILSNAGI